LGEVARHIQQSTNPNRLHEASTEFLATNRTLGIIPAHTLPFGSLIQGHGVPRFATVGSNSIMIELEGSFCAAGVLLYGDVFESPSLVGSSRMEYLFWTNNIWFYHSP